MDLSIRRGSLQIAFTGLAASWLLAAGARAADRGLAARMQDYQKRIDSVEAIMNRFYRGESLDQTRGRVSSSIDGFNELVASRNAQLDAAEAQLNGQLAPLKELGKSIEELDARLAIRPDQADRDAVLVYNALVERRNALVARHNELNKDAKKAVESYNQLVRRVEDEIAVARAGVSAGRSTLDAKVDAYKDFQESDRDAAFYLAVNRLYADLRAEQRRAGTTRAIARAIAQVRGFRRELGVWAVRRAERQENGLVIVEGALPGGESCFLIVDTGAMQTTISGELVEALGLSDRLGGDTKLVLAGGEKIKGRKFTFPQLTVAGQTEVDVTGVVVPSPEVGIDGLLGQSFLKRFVYTIDESRSQKLLLVRR